MEYDALKLLLAEKYANDRNAYTNAKNDWISKKLLEAAN